MKDEHHSVSTMSQMRDIDKQRTDNIIVDIDKQRTDNIIVDIVKSKMKMINFPVDDINRLHIIGNINQGKGQIICRLRNGKIKKTTYTNRKQI